MDIVTNIVKTKREYNITINDEYTIKLSRSVISRLNVGDEIETDELIRESYDSLYEYALNLCARYISYAMRCEAEVIAYLEKKLFPSIIINDVVNRLNELKYLNDEEYIEIYVRSKASDYWGSNKIKNNFIKKGMNPYYVNEKVDFYYSKEIEIENLSYIIEKLDLKYNNMFKREKRSKIVNSCIRKGYDYGEIVAIIDDIITEDENIYDNDKIRDKIRYRFNKYLSKGETIDECKYKVFSFFYAKGYNESILKSVYEELAENLEKK